MIEYYITRENGRLEKAESACPGCWVAAFAPTEDEIAWIAREYGIEPEDARAALDPDEVSRIALEPGYSMVIVDTPVADRSAHDAGYCTIPIAVFEARGQVITVCREADIPLVRQLLKTRVLPSTHETDLFSIEVLMASSAAYLSALRVINRAREAITKEKRRLSRKQLEELYVLDESLVYFKTSLTTIDAVLNRNLRYRRGLDAEATDHFENAVIENRQALETTRIFAEMLDSDIDHFGLLMEHDLNRTMQVVAVVTLVMSVPTVIAGLFGMNLPGIPLGENPFGFVFITAGTLLLTTLILGILKKSRWF